MSRKKISEYRAKTILYGTLDKPYGGIEVDAESASWKQAVAKLPNATAYVAKVDQAVKGRFKKGLVKLNRSVAQLPKDIETLAGKGYRFLLVEPAVPHEPAEERYLALERAREGIMLSYAKVGGIDIEAQQDKITRTLYDPKKLSKSIDLPQDAVARLVAVFDDNYFSFLEINPLVVRGTELLILDAAVEVDDEAEFFEEGWSDADIRQATIKTGEELAVHALNEKSQASFNLEVLNPNGSIFLLLSGGGASVVVADEVYNLGQGKELANYGEYSGAPNKEETYLYTKSILNLLLRSTAKNKKLIIGGGVANFTDVRITFEGIIQALRVVETELKKQKVHIFVRRGGPYEKDGLKLMQDYFDQAGIAGDVNGPDIILSAIVERALGKDRKEAV